MENQNSNKGNINELLKHTEGLANEVKELKQEIKKNNTYCSSIIKKYDNQIHITTTHDNYNTELVFDNNIILTMKTSNSSNITDRSTKIYGEKGIIILENVWDFNSLIYLIKDNIKQNIKYKKETFYQEWPLYMDIMRPISYYKDNIF